MSEQTQANAIVAQLKADISDIKAACRKLSGHPKASKTPDHLIRKLEREVQEAQRHYDSVLAARKQQAAELDRMSVQVQDLFDTVVGERQHSPVQGHIRQLQTQINNTVTQISEALTLQQQHRAELQQVKEICDQYGREIAQVQTDLQKQQECVCQSKAELLRAKHERDVSKRELHAAEQQLTAGRAARSVVLQQLRHQYESIVKDQTCGRRLEQRQQAANHTHGLKETGLQQRASQEQNLASVSSRQSSFLRCESRQVDGSTSASALALQCVRGLFILTGAKTAEQLVTHVQALLQAHPALQEAAEDAAMQLDICIGGAGVAQLETHGIEGDSMKEVAGCS